MITIDSRKMSSSIFWQKKLEQLQMTLRANSSRDDMQMNMGSE